METIHARMESLRKRTGNLSYSLEYKATAQQFFDYIFRALEFLGVIVVLALYYTGDFSGKSIIMTLSTIIAAVSNFSVTFVKLDNRAYENKQQSLYLRDVLT